MAKMREKYFTPGGSIMHDRLLVKGKLGVRVL
jgi:hypothetical protein